MLELHQVIDVMTIITALSTTAERRLRNDLLNTYQMVEVVVVNGTAVCRLPTKARQRLNSHLVSLLHVYVTLYLAICFVTTTKVQHCWLFHPSSEHIADGMGRKFSIIMRAIVAKCGFNS